MSTDTPSDTPWWSQPGTASVPTSVLPPVAEQAPPPPPPAPRRPRKKPGTAALVALALVVGGAAGGAVAELVDEDGGPTSVTSSTPLAGSTVQTSGKSVTGTPESAAAIIGPSVVTIEVTGTSSGAFGAQSVSGTGSGVIIRESGYILTNNHVVDAAVNGGTVHVTLANGKTVAARIVGTAPTADLAVIKIDGESGLKAATFAASENLKVGQAVLAVGAPLGLSNTVTEGIVSTLHRPVATGDSSAQAYIDAVQTDAAINPGNSGGALVDLAGRVVGINSAIASTGDTGSGQSGNIGVGFSIPSETATKVADQLISNGKAVRSQIGVSVANASSTAAGAPGNGALLRDVSSGSPAQQAGLQVGDIVTKVNDRQITDATSLIAAIRSHDPGDKVTLTYVRGGATKTTQVTLGSDTA